MSWIILYISVTSSQNPSPIILRYVQNICLYFSMLINLWKSYNGNSFFLEQLFWENSKEYDFFALILFNISGKLWCADSKGRQLDVKRWRCVSSDSLYSNNCYHNVFKKCHEKSKRGLNMELDISVSLTENFFFQNATILKI